MASLISTNPFTGEKKYEYELMNFDSIQKKFDLAAQTQKDWKNKPLEERVQLVQQAVSYFETHRDIIAADISSQMGRPFSQAKGEISGLIQRANYMCDIAIKTLSPEVIEDSEQFYRAIEHCPLGVIFVISAWNYPLLITINSVIPALIAGNTILLKHSSKTPEIGLHFEKAFNELGGSKGLLQNLFLDHSTTGLVIENLPINQVIFTGSVSGGKQILTHTSKKFMMPQLELGGKDGAYVDCNVNLKHAAETIVDGAMYNAGQSCCGIERAYVHEDVYDEFMKLAKDIVSSYVLGDPRDERTNMGPLCNSHSVRLMLEQLSDAKEKGAEIISGGKKIEINKGVFLEPTLVTNVNHSMSLLIEENFGPILPVMKVKNMNEAIKLINDSDYGLSSAIFSNDEQNVRKFANEVNTGTVFMNRCDYLDPALPWTGVKDSGCGSALSQYGFLGVTRRKSIHFKKMT